MKKIVSIIIIMSLLLTMSPPIFAYSSYQIKVNYLDVDTNHFRLKHGIENPQVLYVKKIDGRIYYNPEVHVTEIEKEKLITTTNWFSVIDDNIIMYEPIVEGEMRIVYGESDLSSWSVKDSIGKRSWNVLKGLTLSVVGFSISNVGGLILGLGDTAISSAISNAHEVEAKSQTKSRVLKKVIQVYDGYSWKDQAEFQRWEEYWQMYTYTYDRLGKETGEFRYTSWPNATVYSGVKMPEVPNKVVQVRYYNNEQAMFQITHDLYKRKSRYTLYQYNRIGESTSYNNHEYWNDYIKKNKIPLN